MSDNGWISIHRKITGNWIWEGKPFSYGQAWIDILLECNHSERKHLIKKKLITTKRGQSSNSLQTWANRWGWSVSATRHFLDLLKIDGMCDTHNAQVTTVLTICNYDTYQNKPHAQGTHDTSHEARTKIPQGTQGIHKQQLDNNNNDNNDILRAHSEFSKISKSKPTQHEKMQITQMVHDSGIETILSAISVCGDYKWDKISHIKKVISGEWPRKEKVKEEVDERYLV
jgi:DNA replication protein DnaD